MNEIYLYNTANKSTSRIPTQKDHKETKSTKEGVLSINKKNKANNGTKSLFAKHNLQSSATDLLEEDKNMYEESNNDISKNDTSSNFLIKSSIIKIIPDNKKKILTKYLSSKNFREIGDSREDDNPRITKTYIKESISEFLLNSSSSEEEKDKNFSDIKKVSQLDSASPVIKAMDIDNIIHLSKPTNTPKKKKSMMNFQFLQNEIKAIEYDEEEANINVSPSNNINEKHESKLKPISQPSSTPLRTLNKFCNVYDSFSSEEDFYEEIEDGFVINEKSLFKQVWNLLMFTCILYYSTVEPFILAFSIEDNSILVAETSMDFCFIFDIVMNFHTPYYVEEKKVNNLQKIKMNYLKGWFLLDTVSSFPSSLLFLIGLDKFKTLKGVLKMSRIYRVFKWAKMFQLLKFIRKDTRKKFDSKIKINDDTGVNRTLNFALIFVLVSHMSTCFWIFLGKLEDSYGATWISGNGLSNSSNLDVYISSMYFNLVTLFTIGYGDVISVTFLERLYNCLLLTVGVFMFSYFISSLSSVFSKMSDQTKLHSQKFDILDDISREYDISDDLYDKIRNKIINYKSVTIETFELLNSLPYNLRKEVIVSMSHNGIKRLNFFKRPDTDFIIFVLPLLRMNNITKNETLIAIDEFIEEMYIVKKGKLSIRLQKTYENVEVADIGDNMHFGEIYMYLDENSPFSLTCKSKRCELFSIKKADFTKIKMAFNENILLILKDSCIFLEKIENVKRIVIELFNSGFNVHEIKDHTKKLQFLLLKGQIDNFLTNDFFELEDIEDFFFSKGIKHIVKFLKTGMTENDFFECFIKNNEDCCNINDNESTLNTQQNIFKRNARKLKGFKNNAIDKINKFFVDIDKIPKNVSNNFTITKNPTILNELIKKKDLIISKTIKNKEDKISDQYEIKPVLELSEEIKWNKDTQFPEFKFSNKTASSILSRESANNNKVFNIYNYGNNYNNSYFINNSLQTSELSIVKNEEFSYQKKEDVFQPNFEIIKNYSVMYAENILEILSTQAENSSPELIEIHEAVNSNLQIPTIVLLPFDPVEHNLNKNKLTKHAHRHSISFVNEQRVNTFLNPESFLYNTNKNKRKFESGDYSTIQNLALLSPQPHKNNNTSSFTFKHNNSLESVHRRASLADSSRKLSNSFNSNDDRNNLKDNGPKIKTKHSLFKDVSSGLMLDEMFQTDKLVLKDKLSNLINEREEVKKKAAIGLKKLNRIMDFLVRKENE